MHSDLSSGADVGVSSLHWLYLRYLKLLVCDYYTKCRSTLASKTVQQHGKTRLQDSLLLVLPSVPFSYSLARCE